MRKPLIAGNWKMNLDHLQAIAYLQKLGWQLMDRKFSAKKADVVLFPPFTDLRTLQTVVQADKLPLAYGAQDLSPKAFGAYTGDISGSFLKALGCAYTLVGHSERRRYHAETNELIAQKLRAALATGLTPVLCVGESEKERDQALSESVCLSQLEGGLESIPKDSRFVVAYEPVWAIGTGREASPCDAESMAALIRARLTQSFGSGTAETVRILYGGSVKAANSAEFLRCPSLDGLLVGGASLDPTEFASIITSVNYL